MPPFTIRFSYGNWIAYAANSPGPEYYFLGADAEAQHVMVQRLQNAMADGEATVRGELTNIFDRVVPGQEDEIMTELFESTTELIYEAQAVYDCAQGVSLLEDITEAGEALAAFV